MKNSRLPRCPVEITISLLDNRWKPLIWCAIFYGKKRFGEIRKNIGAVSTKVLTANLRSMEEAGLLTRTVFAEVPPRVEYDLTDFGNSLEKVLYAMVEWGSAYKCEKEGIIPLRTKNGILLEMMQAGSNDLQNILDLQYLAYQSEARLLNNWEIPPLKQTYQDIVKESVNHTFFKVTDEQERIIASVRGCVQGDTFHIGKLMVHPDWQRLGIGSKMLRALEKLCPNARYELFTSSMSERNICLYNSAGYTEFKREKISDALEFVYLEKFCSAQC